MTRLASTAAGRLCRSCNLLKHQQQHEAHRWTASVTPTAAFHTTPARLANPSPHATVVLATSPPPPPAAAEAEGAGARRVERKKAQLDMLKESLAAAKRGNGGSGQGDGKAKGPLQKRFWKDVEVREVDDGLQIYLDSRPVRTASKNILTVPRNKRHLAAAIALEWDLLVTAQQALKNHYIPLTSLTSRAVDIAVADAAGDARIRDAIVATALGYLRTDTLMCWAPATGREAALRALQMRAAEPVTAYMAGKVWPGVEIRPVLGEDSILPVEQPQMTMEVVKGWVAGLAPWDLAGLERGVLASKSLLVAARLLVEWSESFRDLRGDGHERERFGIEAAAEASTVEVRWQTGMWGEVEDTHDVEKEDLRRQLGSVVLLVNGGS